jgi:hypothetical protein
VLQARSKDNRVLSFWSSWGMIFHSGSTEKVLHWLLIFIAKKNSLLTQFEFDFALLSNLSFEFYIELCSLFDSNHNRWRLGDFCTIRKHSVFPKKRYLRESRNYNSFMIACIRDYLKTLELRLPQFVWD